MFQGSGGFVELGLLNRHFVKIAQKKDPTVKKLGIFSSMYS